jgi:hypothetical protein
MSKKVMRFESKGVKMKKNGKNNNLQFEKTCFLYSPFSASLLLCISKMICRAWEGVLITFEITQMEKNWERFANMFDHRHMIGDGSIYPKESLTLVHHWTTLYTKNAPSSPGTSYDMVIYQQVIQFFIFEL